MICKQRETFDDERLSFPWYIGVASHQRVSGTLAARAEREFESPKDGILVPKETEGRDISHGGSTIITGVKLCDPKEPKVFGVLVAFARSLRRVRVSSDILPSRAFQGQMMCIRVTLCGNKQRIPSDESARLDTSVIQLVPGTLVARSAECHCSTINSPMGDGARLMSRPGAEDTGLEDDVQMRCSTRIAPGICMY